MGGVDSLNAWQPKILSVLRIVAGLLFMQHGIVKHFAFPVPFPSPIAQFSQLWIAGGLEIIGGTLLACLCT